jgi:hypothetical protein
VHRDVLARRKQLLRFFSQNCLGLKTDAKRQQLVTTLKQRNSYAAALQETWHPGSGIFQINDFQLIMVGPESQAGRGTKGIGIALSPDAIKDWESAGSQQFVSVDLRSLGIRLASKDTRGRDAYVFFVTAYAPVGVADQLEWNAFFDGFVHGDGASSEEGSGSEEEDSYFVTSDSDTGGGGGDNNSFESSYDSGVEAAGSGGDSPQRATWEPSTGARRSHYETRSRTG